MELIRNLPTRISNSGYLESWGIFYCEYSKDFVEKKLSDGKKAKSCGCVQYKLQAQAIKGKNHTEEHNKKISEGNKGKIVSEETKQKIRESNIGQKRTEEQRENMSKSHIGKKLPKEQREKISESTRGENHYNWQNGKSFEEYGIEFNKELKKFIKTRDLNVCQTLGCMETKHLCIHHIDYDKKNNNPDNLITLCVSCHSKTNFSRDYWINYYKEIRGIYL